MSFWKRPDHVPYPSVWLRFNGNKYPDMEPLEYTVEDLTEDLFEFAIFHMERYFLIRESMCGTSGYIEDNESTEEIKDIWRFILNQRMSLVAIVTDKETGKRKVAGVNITGVVHSSEKDHDYNFQGKEMKKIWRNLKDLEAPVDVFSMYDTDVYLTALGLSVSPEYHRENVGYNLLLARTKLCWATGIPVTVTAFTGQASQHIAAKAGFKTIAEINYETYMQDGKVAYPKLKGPEKLMAKIINEDTDE